MKRKLDSNVMRVILKIIRLDCSTEVPVKETKTMPIILGASLLSKRASYGGICKSSLG
jgi:hypothetical protein